MFKLRETSKEIMLCQALKIDTYKIKGLDLGQALPIRTEA
jgi:hypothetical protein